MVECKPYYISEKDETEEYTIERRVFENYDPKTLFWHRDRENRKIKLIEGNIQLQIDNKLPYHIEIDKEYFIEAMVYHRVIANEKFIVDVYKFK